MAKLGTDDVGVATAGTWADTYRGHRIAVQRQEAQWQVAVNDQPQTGVLFEDAQEAAAWLRRRVDAVIAEQIFPGLARI